MCEGVSVWFRGMEIDVVVFVACIVEALGARIYGFKALLYRVPTTVTVAPPYFTAYFTLRITQFLYYPFKCSSPIFFYFMVAAPPARVPCSTNRLFQKIKLFLKVK